MTVFSIFWGIILFWLLAVGRALPLHHFGAWVSDQCKHIYTLGDPVKALGDPVFNS